MKPAIIFHQYIWIINALRTSGGLTLRELSRQWQQDGVTDGNALSRTSFNRHRDAIQDMFGIVIACEPDTHRYYISNPSALYDDSIERWLYSTLTVHGVLTDSVSIKERVILENVPAGEEHLDAIIRAIRTSRRLLIGYRKFHAEGYERTVSPYALKLFHQRWYLLACIDGGQMRIYALDRMTRAVLTDEPFTMPRKFRPQAYFAEYYGVLTDATPLAHVVVRAHHWTPDYLRTLPLHHSQHELASGPDYADFSYDLRPTADFLAQLLSHGPGIEVLEPSDVREKMRRMLAEGLRRYEANVE